MIYSTAGAVPMKNKEEAKAFVEGFEGTMFIRRVREGWAVFHRNELSETETQRTKLANLIREFRAVDKEMADVGMVEARDMLRAAIKKIKTIF